MKPICLSLLLLTGVLLHARGDTLRTDINPALLYYRAFLAAPDPMSDEDRSFLESKAAREQKLPGRFGAILMGYDNQFLLIQQAARAKMPCDWGVDPGGGPNALLPYLPRAKAACEVAQWRAVWALQHGRPDEARNELLDAFALSRNTGSDNLLIGTWVQFATECNLHATVAQFFGDFPPETLKQLVQGFDAAPARHTLAACIPADKQGTFDWLLNKILELQKTYPGDDAKVMLGIRQCGFVSATDFTGESHFWSELIASSGGTSEGVLKLLREIEPLYPRVNSLMAMPQQEYEVQAKKFAEEIAKSRNPFFSGIKALFSGWTVGSRKLQFRSGEFKAEAYLAMVRAAVEFRLNGDEGRKGVMDPFGSGPFEFQRFVFQGVDRGFQLKSAYAGVDGPFTLIFVEKQGPAFQIAGAETGKALTQ